MGKANAIEDELGIPPDGEVRKRFARQRLSEGRKELFTLR